MKMPNIMTPFLFLLLSLVTYRLSMLIAVEKGPARVLAKLRKLTPKSSVREGLSCPHCVGIWVSAIVTIAVIGLSETWLMRVVYCLALAGASSFLVRIGRAPE